MLDVKDLSASAVVPLSRLLFARGVSSPKNLKKACNGKLGSGRNAPVLSWGVLSKSSMTILRGFSENWKHLDKTSLLRRADPNPLSESSPGGVKPKRCRRLVVLGAPGVGKSSIVGRFLRGTFEDVYVPTKEDFHRMLYQIRGQRYQLEVLDATGERGFPARRRLSILTGDVFLLVFSLDDRKSFQEVCSLLDEINEAKSKAMKSNWCPHVPSVVCGNKVDGQTSQRAVSREEVLQALAGKATNYFETSAKNDFNMDAVYQALVDHAGLPSEAAPSHHRKVSVRSFQARCQRDLAPCGVLYPSAVRPSFSSDLQRVMGSGRPRKK
ncbi:GTP-binding protein Rhes-like [Erpetoichthys calabaricus]|uniref:RASD family member 2b n=1 Tax=Erpetoichthys calabaricus TaxID=27687 RepID=A0A8C4TTT5_ERPCA|nr:GTP-binding protein Rhes-like [Erpetoichthys calabaricus]